MTLLDCVGADVSRVLTSEPFTSWPFRRSIEDDLDERLITYVFPDNGLELRCDGHETITAIFLFADERGGFDDSLFEIPFSLRRKQVLEHFGVPSASGGGTKHPVLGNYGPWDRFERAGLAIHVEYHLDADRISKITLMRADVVPESV